MDETLIQRLIRVTTEDRKKTLQNFEVDDDERIREGLVVITDWCQKQDHFVEKNLNKNLLERLFVLSKGSIEETKRRIDRMLTSRGMMSDLTLNRTMGEFQRMCQCIYYIALPKMHPVDQSRIMLTQFLTNKLDEFNILTYFRYAFLNVEYRYNYDCALAERYILDMKNITLNLLSKVNPIVVKKSEILSTEGLGIKIKGIHIVNAPSFIDKLVFILKQALREKVANRLHVHMTYEDLHKHIPKEVLPIDYGGEEQEVNKLNALWQEEFLSPAATEFNAAADRLVTDESKRSSEKFNEEYLGMPGSFRKLNVD